MLALLDASGWVDSATPAQPSAADKSQDRLSAQKIWLGREDSNLRMAESKSAALPLGYAPSDCSCIGRVPGKVKSFILAAANRTSTTSQSVASRLQRARRLGDQRTDRKVHLSRSSEPANSLVTRQCHENVTNNRPQRDGGRFQVVAQRCQVMRHRFAVRPPGGQRRP